MATYLDEILNHHRSRAAADGREWRERVGQLNALGPSMLAALSGTGNGRVKVIAEVKRRSPSKGWLHEGLDVTQIARDYAEGGATAISVLTDAEHFAGSLEDLDAVARAVNLPLLRKDFTVSANDVLDAVEAGASAVLLIVAALSNVELTEFISLAHGAGLDAIVEVHDHDEARRSLDVGARIIGVNQRNLHNAAHVMESLPTSIVTVCESGLSSPDDVARAAEAGFDAVLVGEAFVTASQVTQTVRAFSSVPLVSRD